MATSDTRSVARAVRSALGRGIFVPATTRLFWVPVHLLVFSLCAMVVSWGQARGLSPFWFLPLSVLVGMSFAGLAFVAHETLHGALTRSRFLRRFVGFVGFAPFCVSPRLWIAWHNRVHHGNTNVAGRDPDAYPDWAEFRDSRAARLAVLWGAPRRDSWRGWITLALGFSLQSLQILLFARKRNYLSRRNYALAWLETLLAASFWGFVYYAVGFQLFIVLYVVPLLFANAIVMAHIITNHSLSPLCKKNDALASSLTVSVPKWFEFYSLGFGYHIEHHLFPAMSNRHAPRVQEELKRLVPHRYQEMPLTQALALMFTTPRVYATPSTLVDPKTGETFRTLGPGEEAEQPQNEVTPSLRGASAFDDWARVSAAPRVAPEGRAERTSTIPPPSAA